MTGIDDKLITAGCAVVCKYPGKSNYPNLNQVVAYKNSSGRLGLPGGKRELGETIEQCVLRELKEETGLEGKIVCHLYTGLAGEHICSAYLVYVEDVTFNTTEDGEPQWIKWTDLIYYGGPFLSFNTSTFTSFIDWYLEKTKKQTVIE